MDIYDQAVEGAAYQIDKTRLYAPTDGVISKKNFNEGEVVTAYAAVFGFISDSKLEIQANISEVEVKKLALGDKAMIKFISDDSSGYDVITSSVASISTVETANASGNAVTYKIKFPFSSLTLKSGMTGDVAVTLSESKNTLIIPVSSVLSEDGKNYVLLGDENSQVKQEVQLGSEDGHGNVQVFSGVKEHDKIVQFN